MADFKRGEYIIYINGDRYEIGRIKSVCDDGCFVAYHEGETGAKTPFDKMHKIINAHCIQKTSLGGKHFVDCKDKPQTQVSYIKETTTTTKAYSRTECTPTHDLHTPSVSQHAQSVERVETYSCQCDCKHWSDKVGRCLLVKCQFERKE